jgi:hypothetical protein
VAFLTYIFVSKDEMDKALHVLTDGEERRKRRRGERSYLHVPSHVDASGIQQFSIGWVGEPAYYVQ